MNSLCSYVCENISNVVSCCVTTSAPQAPVGRRVGSCTAPCGTSPVELIGQVTLLQGGRMAAGGNVVEEGKKLNTNVRPAPAHGFGSLRVCSCSLCLCYYVMRCYLSGKLYEVAALVDKATLSDMRRCILNVVQQSASCSDACNLCSLTTDFVTLVARCWRPMQRGRPCSRTSRCSRPCSGATLLSAGSLDGMFASVAALQSAVPVGLADAAPIHGCRQVARLSEAG